MSETNCDAKAVLGDEVWNTHHAKTCRNIDDDYDSYFECSECGCHVLCEFYGSGYGEPRFCPGCGRKVKG